MEVRVGSSAVVDGRVGLLDRLHELVGCRLLVGALDGVDGDTGGDLAPAGATHPVGDDVEAALLDQHIAVLVDRTDPADVGRGACSQRDGRLGHASSITVLPICSLSPRCMTIGPATLRRFRYVPLVEPRSSTYHLPSRAKTRAWSWLA